MLRRTVVSASRLLRQRAAVPRICAAAHPASRRQLACGPAGWRHAGTLRTPPSFSSSPCRASPHHRTLAHTACRAAAFGAADIQADVGVMVEGAPQLE